MRMILINSFSLGLFENTLSKYILAMASLFVSSFIVLCLVIFERKFSRSNAWQTAVSISVPLYHIHPSGSRILMLNKFVFVFENSNSKFAFAFNARLISSAMLYFSLSFRFDVMSITFGLISFTFLIFGKLIYLIYKIIFNNRSAI